MDAMQWCHTRREIIIVLVARLRFLLQRRALDGLTDEEMPGLDAERAAGKWSQWAAPGRYTR